MEIYAAGGEIAGAADAFTFLHRSLAGDGSITARVSEVTWSMGAKIGLMLRQELTPESRQASFLLTKGAATTKASAFIRRDAPFSSAIAGTFAVPDIWIRLERKAGEAPPLIAIDGTATVREALALMEKYNVSQIPVIEDSEQLGSLSEGTLLSRVLAEPQAIDRPLADYLEPPFPTVDETASMKAVIGHLTGGDQALLVCRGRQFVGILTKFDVLHFVTNGGGR